MGQTRQGRSHHRNLGASGTKPPGKSAEKHAYKYVPLRRIGLRQFPPRPQQQITNSTVNHVGGLLAVELQAGGGLQELNNRRHHDQRRWKDGAREVEEQMSRGMADLGRLLPLVAENGNGDVEELVQALVCDFGAQRQYGRPRF